jgi:hypothetical protein
MPSGGLRFRERETKNSYDFLIRVVYEVGVPLQLIIIYTRNGKSLHDVILL